MVAVTPTAVSAQSGRQLAWLNGVVLVLVIASTFAVIYSTHDCRAMYSSLQELESSQWYLQEDYGRLLLEHSTWASHYRVEKVALEELGMHPPAMDHLKVVPR
jgi:cell division protein FtsL